MNNRFAFLRPISEQETGLRNRHKAPEPRESVHTGERNIPAMLQAGGNLAVQQLFSSSAVQAKLAISQPVDVHEEKADRVADQVMRVPEPNPHRSCARCQTGGTPCPKCQAEKATVVQRKKLAVHRCALDEVCETDESVAYRGNLGDAACDFHSGRMKASVQKEHCAGNCVAQHEAQHSQDLGQCCAGYAQCIATAGDTKNRCHDNWNEYFRRVEYWTECNAYSREYGCLRNLFLDQCSLKSERVDKSAAILCRKR